MKRETYNIDDVVEVSSYHRPVWISGKVVSKITQEVLPDGWSEPFSWPLIRRKDWSKSFSINQRVMVRDKEEDVLQSGKVTSLSPLEVLVDDYDKSFSFKIVVPEDANARAMFLQSEEATRYQVLRNLSLVSEYKQNETARAKRHVKKLENTLTSLQELVITTREAEEKAAEKSQAAQALTAGKATAEEAQTAARAAEMDAEAQRQLLDERKAMVNVKQRHLKQARADEAGAKRTMEDAVAKSKVAHEAWAQKTVV